MKIYEKYDMQERLISYKKEDEFWANIKYDENGNCIEYIDSDKCILTNSDGLPLIMSINRGTVDDELYHASITKFNQKNHILYKKDILTGDVIFNSYSKEDDKAIYVNSNGYKRLYRYDENGNKIYSIDNNGYEEWWEYDENGNVTKYTDSQGYEEQFSCNENGKCIYHKDNDGSESWWKYDDKGREIYYKNSCDGIERWKKYSENGLEVCHQSI